MSLHTCLLPGGYIDAEGNIYKEVVLIPLNGREEEILASSGNSSASLVTTILSSTIKRIGNISDITSDIVGHLLVADRQYLMLKLRELTFGDFVQATLACPWPDCGERVDIDFNISNIPVKQGMQARTIHELKLSEKAVLDTDWAKKNNTLKFRLPNGRDQELIAPVLIDNEAEALTQLLWRCIKSLGDITDISIENIRDLTSLARMEIENKMQELSPEVELEMQACCPECGRKFTAPFDIQAFFFGEFRVSRELLYKEVHYLAYHYHWSEKEIMDFPGEKRRHYIEVLANEIERLNNATA